MSLEVLDVVLIAGMATFISGLFIILTRFAQQGSARCNMAPTNEMVFLLKDNVLIDGSPAAMGLFEQVNTDEPDREALIDLLEPSFPTVRKYIDAGPSETVMIDATGDSDSRLKIAAVGEALRITVLPNDDALHPQIVPLFENKQNSELLELREVVKNAPTMMWRCNPQGQLVWANDAYLKLNDACADPDVTPPRLPINPLFENLDLTVGAVLRSSVLSPSTKQPHWYDISTFQSDGDTLYYATDADPIVRSEMAQYNFVQTLGQTFAHLSIGLAIFDHRRQLATFNPALLDMTNLNFEFLSGRPSIDMVLDQLREQRMLPEPKNYASWRDQFTKMEQDARSGTYAEHWNLPDGQTFRVSGRPHPDGAFVLLFEDITAEISLTRRFRSEIETSQAVLDHMDDAIAVFSNNGNLVMVNTVYSALWGTDLSEGLVQYDLRAELRKWQDRCTPTRMWTNLRDISQRIGDREAMTDTAILDDGRHMTCQANPISGGMTLIRFRFDKTKSPTMQKLTQIDPSLMLAKG